MGNCIQAILDWIPYRKEDEKTFKDDRPTNDHVITHPCHVLTARNEMVYLNQWLVDKDQQLHFVLHTLPEHTKLLQDLTAQDEMIQEQVKEMKKKMDELEKRISTMEQHELRDELDMVIVTTV